MSSLEELVAAMLGADTQNAIKAENPYYNIGKTTSQISELPLSYMTKNPGQYSISEALPLALGLGLVNGITQGIGDEYQTTLSDRYSKVFGDVLSGAEPSGDGLSSNLFGQAKRQGQLFKLQNAISDAQELKKFKLDREAKFEDKLLDYGITIERGANGERVLKQIPGLDVNSQAASKAAAEEIAKRTVSGEYIAVPPAPRSQPIALPTGPNGASEEYVATDFEPVAAAPKAPIDLRNPSIKAGEDATDALRKEFAALPEVKNYSIVQKSAGIIDKALKDPSSVSDQELVRYSILLIEPGMAVREGESAAVAASQSIPEAWKGIINKSLSGGTSLSNEAREGLKRLAARAYEGHRASYEIARKFYENQATAKGLDPSRVSYLGVAPEVSAIISQDPTGISAIQSKAAEILAKRKQGVSATQPQLMVAPTPIATSVR